MKDVIKILAVIAFFSTMSYAQWKEIPGIDINASNLSGNLKLDYYSLQVDTQLENSLPTLDEDKIPVKKKSPLLAGALSLLVPGAGEFYTKSYWKTAAFLAIEAAAITVAIIYDKKGNDQTDLFQNYADENWSVVKYAEWLIQNKEGNPNIITSNDPSIRPWQRVNWSLLNESEVGSHTLPAHGEQQYYEMIGKYHQFSPGWNDFPAGQTTNEPISANFRYYAGERGKANDFYSVASTFIKVMVANHFLSAIDAAWSASRYNKKLDVSMKMKEINIAGRTEFSPEMSFKYNF